MSRRHPVGVAVAAGTVLLAASCTALLVASCSTTVRGEPVSVFDDPFHVAGMDATDGPTGPRPDAPASSRDVTNSDDGEIDALAAGSVSDVEEFWRGAYGETFDGKFTPVTELISWDSYGFDGSFCGKDTHGLVNAAFCYRDETIGWDRGELLPALRHAYGDMGITIVLAHEYGHAVQRQAGLTDNSTPHLVAEQQADCLSGVYMRWVAEGNSPRFTLSTGDGLNNVLAAVIAFRDPLLNEGHADVGVDEHGSAFERVSAFQLGFTDGASSCAAMNLKEISERRGDLPVLLARDQTGEWPVTEESVRVIIDATRVLFSLPNPPQLNFDASAASDCADALPSPPVSYCPASNTIVVDMAELETMSVQSNGEDTGLVTGDNTAYSVLVSRYMQAVEHERGVVLDNAQAALRTACLTGVATMKMSNAVTMPDGHTIALTAGDIDEAVSGILTNGLVASDVNGDSVPSGFSRIDAFRIGVLGDEERCFERFP